MELAINIEYSSKEDTMAKTRHARVRPRARGGRGVDAVFGGEDAVRIDLSANSLTKFKIGRRPFQGRTMRKILLLIAAIALVALAAVPQNAIAADSDSLPSRVNPKNWIRITPTVGFVVSSMESPPKGQENILYGDLRGYFMAKYNGVWCIMKPEPGARPTPAAK